MDLFEAFGLAPGSIVAAVGGGGKTSLLFELALEAEARGLAVILTTTTKFTRPLGVAMPPIVEAGDATIVARLREVVVPGATVVATSGGGAHGRLLGFAPETVDAMGSVGAGLVAVEADGSAHRPFKAPADHEPVIPASATHVIVCVGLEVLGRPLCERHVHRPEIVAALAALAPGAPVTEETIASVLLHEEGGRKNVPGGARLCALLNNPPSAAHDAAAARIARQLACGGYAVAVVAAAHRRGDIRAVARSC